MGDEPERHAGGRPTLYDPAFPEQARKLSELGATDLEIADFFGVDARTFYRWRNQHEEFCQALIVGKAALDDRVERSLFMRAVGYERDAVKIFMPSGSPEPVYAPYREHIAADPGAAKLWLTNRRGEVWRDKKEVDVKGDIASMLAERRARAADG
jgi:transposase-like protein